MTPTSAAGRRVLRIGFVLGSLFLGVHLLLPLAGGLEATAEALARATWWLPWVLLVLEAGTPALLLPLGAVLAVIGGQTGATRSARSPSPRAQS